MATTFQIVNPDDTTQILFDLNDTAGTNSALYGSVKTTIFDDVDLGSAKLDSNAPDIGRALAFNRSSFADLKFRLRIYNASSYDNLNKALGVLSGFLADGCVMKWVPNGSSQTRYIDVLPSVTPALLDGKELSLYTAFQLFDTPEGVEISLQRLGYVRKAKLTASDNVLVNPTLLRDSDANGTPDSWTATGTLTVVAANEAMHVVAAGASQGATQQTAAASFAVGNVVTLSAEIKVTSGTCGIVIDWRTAANANISFTQLATITGTSWARYSVTGTAPATTDHVIVILQSFVGAATFDVRNVQLELASSASEFRVPGATMNVDPAATGFAQFMPVYNPSDAPAPCEITTAFPDSSSKIVEVDYALISERGVVGSRALSDFLNGPNYAQAESTAGGWTITLSGDTTSTADVNSSGGNVARIAHTTDPTIAAKRITASRTTLLDGMRGRMKVYARVKAAAAREFNMQLRWGAGTVAGEANDPVVHDATLVTGTFHYVYIDLGDIELPRERNITIGQLTLELWTWETSGTAQNLDVDHFTFVPTDDSAIASIPPGASLTETGKNLTTPPKQMAGDPVWTAGAVSGSAVRLNAVNEAAGWGSNTNGIFTGTAGLYRIVVFDLNVHMQAGGGSFGSLTYLAQVANITDADLLDANGVSMSQSFTQTTSIRHTVSLIMAEEAADKYQPRVYISARTGNPYIDIVSITMYSWGFIPQNGKLRSDPGSLPSRSAVEQLDSSGNLGLAADSTGTPFWLPPGLSLIYVNAFDLPTAGYYENKSDLTSGAKRTMTVTPTVFPRYWQ